MTRATPPPIPPSPLTTDGRIVSREWWRWFQTFQATSAPIINPIPDGTIISNISGAINSAVANSLTDILDHDAGAAPGDFLFRGSLAWGVLASPIPGANGGTGVANTGKTITLAGNLATSGAFALTLTVTAITNSTFPAGTHNLAALDVVQTFAAAQTFAQATTFQGNATLSGASLIEGFSYNTPLTGATVTMAANERRCVINPAGTLAALTVVLPPSPVNGQVAGVSSTQAIIALTVGAGTGGAAVVGAPAALTAGQAFSMLYRATGNSWYISA